MPKATTAKPDVVVFNKIQENIIHAAMQHFQVPEEILIAGTTDEIAYMRYCTFYLTKKNTDLSTRFIGFRLKRGRSSVLNGIDNIESSIKLKYRQTLDDIKKIAEIAGISET